MKFKVGDTVIIIDKKFSYYSKNLGVIISITKSLPYPYTVKINVTEEGRIVPFSEKQIEKASKTAIILFGE